MLERPEIARQLREVIEEERRIVIANDDEKLYIDSFTMVLVVMFIKENLGIQLNLENLHFDETPSINALVDLVLIQSSSKTSSKPNLKNLKEN